VQVLWWPRGARLASSMQPMASVVALHPLCGRQRRPASTPAPSDMRVWTAATAATWIACLPRVSTATKARLVGASVTGQILCNIDHAELTDRFGMMCDRECAALLEAVAAEVGGGPGAETAAPRAEPESEVAHAVLSPSSSARWLVCPPSARLEQRHSRLDTKSWYAEEGNFAHSLAATQLKRAFGQLSADDHAEEMAEHAASRWRNPEMDAHVDGYVEWCVNEARAMPARHVELRVAMDRWVPGGFGTADLVLASDTSVHVVDFKYGKSAVPTANNTQLRLYALGALQHEAARLEGCDDVEVRTSIYQPRVGRNAAVTKVHTQASLVQWAVETVRPAAQLAWAGEGKFAPGSHCRYCNVRAICRARASAAATAWISKEDTEAPLTPAKLPQPDTLTDEQIVEILKLAPSIRQWLMDVGDYGSESGLVQTQRRRRAAPSQRVSQGELAKRIMTLPPAE